MFPVLLCGPAVNLDQLEGYTPAQPSDPWKGVTALDIDPVRPYS